MPSAVLSTHTGGFTGFTFRDLTDDMPKIKDHWVKENIKFDAIYTGYLGSTKQIDYVKDIMSAVAGDGCVTVVDPAMADNGKLYTGFDMAFVNEMKKLCATADFILPNMTEAAFLTDTPYSVNMDADEIMEKLLSLGCKNVILKGVNPEDNTKMGILMHINGEKYYYEHERLPNSCHGTGDVYASAFVGSLMRGKAPQKAVEIAARYVIECIKETAKEDNHWYGAKFETSLGKLIKSLE
jgi:pyridoxine kinase